MDTGKERLRLRYFIRSISTSSKFTDIWKDGLDGDGKMAPNQFFEMQAYVGENGKNDKGTFWEQARMYARGASVESGTWAGAGIHQQIACEGMARC